VPPVLLAAAAPRPAKKPAGAPRAGGVPCSQGTSCRQCCMRLLKGDRKLSEKGVDQTEIRKCSAKLLKHFDLPS